MFEKLQNTATRYLPPVLLFAALAGVAAAGAEEAVDHSAQGGVAGRAAIDADLAIMGYVSDMSHDLDRGKYEAAEAANKKMEAEQGVSTARHNEVDSNHRAELTANRIAAIFSAAAASEVTVIAVRTSRRRGKH